MRKSKDEGLKDVTAPNEKTPVPPYDDQCTQNQHTPLTRMFNPLKKD